jgi:hypothetical protein
VFKNYRTVRPTNGFSALETMKKQTKVGVFPYRVSARKVLN